MKILFGPVPPDPNWPFLTSLRGAAEVFTFSYGPGGDVALDPGVHTAQDLWANLPLGFRPDVALLYSFCQNAILPGWTRLPCPTAGMMGDWVRNVDKVAQVLGYFDLIVCRDSLGVNFCRAHGVQAIFRTHFGYDPEQHRPFPKRQFEYDVLFVGSCQRHLWRKRLEMVERASSLSDEFRVCIAQGAYGRDYTRLLNSSRLVLNASAEGEVNMRVFEALGCGAALLTDDSSDLRRFFVPGRDLLVHHYDDLEQRIREALADERMLEEIRRNAEVAARAYTNDKQAARITEDLRAFVQAEIPARRWRENWNSLGYAALVTNGLETMAERCFSLHRQSLPGDFAAYNNLAYILLDRSLREEHTAERSLLLRAALGELEAANEAYPDSLVVKFNKAKVLELLGDLDGAQLEMEDVLALTERANLPPEAYAGLVWEELRFSRLRIRLNWAQVNHNDDVLAMVGSWRKLVRAAAAARICDLALKQGETSRYEAALHRAIALDDSNGTLWLELGKRHPDKAKGLDALRRASVLEPGLTEAWEQLAEGCASLGLAEEAREWESKLRRLQKCAWRHSASAA